MPESSAIAGWRDAAARARALINAFSSNVSPVSSTPGSWATTSHAGPRMSWISATLWALPVASRMRTGGLPLAGDRAERGRLGHHLPLELDQLLDPLLGQPQHRVQLAPAER